MAHVIVLGAGIGGLPAAFELRQTLGNEHQITLINANDYFQFVPSNPWLAVGWRTRDAITLPLKPLLKKHNIDFVTGWVSRIDAEANRLFFEDGNEINYDYLLIATGPQLAFEEVEGSGPTNGFTQSVCTVDHAEKTHADVKRLLDDPGPVIVGAVQFASCFGPAYEYAAILDTALRKHKLRDKVPMTFVTSEPYVGHLGLGGVGDSRGLLEHELRNRHINWITNARVSRVEADTIYIDQLDEGGEVAKQHELPFKHAMLLPGFKGVAPVAEVEGLCNPRGFVMVDAHQRSPKYPNIYSAGVCIAIPPVETTPVPTGAPKTGYMIESMVAAIVQNIQAELAGRPVTATATWNAFCLADLGDTGAAFIALPQIPPRNVTWFKKGKWVHWAKIAFEKYFLYKMRNGKSEPSYEKWALKIMGIMRLK
ncbi:NAD(P)/FAD-dependent oxidoreductase [Sulfuriflexus sp.]|uniref:NAD(P)/FAD-dependent oxidoreductase n=1 Tax=Sulfuriflexus sp. TaxID=2015443 RepID=UPI0028CD4B21|nr:FAD-dependent oxidoreductase [Sulfuriflexus sp.]MDT8404419.1 FAD-dependent oxidoreductase [Sulfuriflexus sp.]